MKNYVNVSSKSKKQKNFFFVGVLTFNDENGSPEPDPQQNVMDPEKHCLYLGDNGIQDLALEGAEDDGLVLDGIDNKPLARLDQTRSHTVNCRHCNHEPVFACKKTHVLVK
jgi:hypothetical protein